MGREWLLSMLIVLLGGLALQPLAALERAHSTGDSASELERRSWLRLWYPVAPSLIITAWLCGWGLAEPDPVPDRLGPWALFAAWAPFAVIFGRALLRAGWALLRSPPECGVSTVGLVRPQVVFSPFLAKQLEDAVIHAALAHERAHALHRDPLRIWLAQLVTDLQWPWPSAQRRFDVWIHALELARDDEARAGGADGADLAAAMLASVRFLTRVTPQQRAGLSGTQFVHARLVGDPQALRERVSRLLAPPPEASRRGPRRLLSPGLAVLLLLAVLLTAAGLGLVYGERLMHPLLALTS